jgi:Flp pilus assembly protein TadD
MALKIVKSSPTAATREQAMLAAQRAFAHGELERAAKFLLQALEMNEQDPDAYLQLGVILFKDSKYDKAVIALRRSLELCPDQPDALNALGVIMYTLGWHAASEVFFRRVLELKPDHPAAKNSLLEAMRQVRDNGDTIAPELEYLVALARPQAICASA